MKFRLFNVYGVKQMLESQQEFYKDTNFGHHNIIKYVIKALIVGKNAGVKLFVLNAYNRETAFKKDVSTQILNDNRLLDMYNSVAFNGFVTDWRPRIDMRM